MVFLFFALKTHGQQLYSSWSVLLPRWGDIDLPHSLFNLFFTTGKPQPLFLSLLLGGLAGSLVLPLRRTWPVRLSWWVLIMALMLLARAITRTAGLVTESSHLNHFFFTTDWSWWKFLWLGNMNSVINIFLGGALRWKETTTRQRDLPFPEGCLRKWCSNLKSCSWHKIVPALYQPSTCCHFFSYLLW